MLQWTDLAVQTTLDWLDTVPDDDALCLPCSTPDVINSDLQELHVRCEVLTMTWVINSAGPAKEHAVCKMWHPLPLLILRAPKRGGEAGVREARTRMT